MNDESDAASRPVAGASERLSTAEAAARLRVAPATLRVWRKKGVGPSYVKVGVKTVWYERADLEAYLDNARVELGEQKARGTARCLDTDVLFADVPADDWVYSPPNEAAE